MVYINGATAVPWVKTIKTPNTNKIVITGNNQNFFLANKKLINSIKSFSYQN